ncbi:hypothetical protein IGI04_010787 [Brassica rapa subsp. trilocularis]|uniref:Uncharacterized protein n=1 Tax=Brassica rapa subsp. trilocularis TaxID=1813537 RepID=A0ABQ7N234_BRACM|nr:hypothetical protein IGI04_010787 [Brassica rapa subsp. trilocularis]
MFEYKKSGRSSSTVEVRLLRFWEARNIRCADELLLVDTNVSFVLGFLRRLLCQPPLGLTEPNPVLHTLKNAFHSVVKARCLL